MNTGRLDGVADELDAAGFEGLFNLLKSAALALRYLIRAFKALHSRPPHASSIRKLGAGHSKKGARGPDLSARYH